MMRLYRLVAVSHSTISQANKFFRLLHQRPEQDAQGPHPESRPGQPARNQLHAFWDRPKQSLGILNGQNVTAIYPLTGSFACSFAHCLNSHRRIAQEPPKPDFSTPQSAYRLQNARAGSLDKQTVTPRPLF